MRRWTFGLDIELVHGQPASCWARPVSIDGGLEVIMWIRCLRGERLPKACYLCSSPKSAQTNFFASERREIEIFCLFFLPQPTTHLRSRYTLHPRSTRFVSGKASEYRQRPPKIHADAWSRGREVARDVLRSLPKPEKCLFFAIGDGSRFFIMCFLYTSGQMFFSQTPGRRHPRVGRSP